ncbi:dihydrofolate reductase family protein [Actinomadura sp. WMMB 499]|uniref:dihydrofolate reductase family protein n=1 Tax=Actinomadura sp. WMMB 499 TaxID=1219491 RepID=UPI0012469343|nr:dihydrofolate reductase family protein [Actinomadura sp. WMMB 499]QFG22684.1 dihydrofolate reductase family protein [Actinomadura sp. WMMB 499]
MASKLIVGMFVSVDGVLQAPGGPGEDESGGFRQGGWVAPHTDEGFGRIVGAWFERADALLLGRRTYDIMAAYWPNVPEEDGAFINDIAKYVATHRPMTAEWRNTEVLAGEAAETVADLKARTDGVIMVEGSGDLLRTLQRADLVDEYHLVTFPVVLGQGKRLFENGTPPAALRLTETRATDAGAVYTVYERAGEPVYGTVG